jgi:hypothetical protein
VAAKRSPDDAKLDKVVADARRQQDARLKTYREQALKLYPWICTRCTREFTHANLQELTVHHKDHDHDNNPADGSNWELLCVYCHENEHARQVEARRGAAVRGDHDAPATHKPFSALKDLLKNGQ